MAQRTKRTEKLDLRLTPAASASVNSCSTLRSARPKNGLPIGGFSHSTAKTGMLS